VLERHRAADIEIIPLGSDRYPAVLAADHERPMVLFSRGDLDRIGPPRVALVGTRRATSGGRRTARTWGRALSEVGVQVVSGLALGIDGSAHLGALDALDAGGIGTAPPLGVVGTGLDVVYPRRHADLWERVATDGLLLSEVPAGGGPTRWRFPARNRIIAALADVLVVVESHERGGALSTAEAAVDRDRAVLAVPGSLHTPAAAGSNKLLVDGATPACEIADIVGQLALSSCDRLVESSPPMLDDAAQPELTSRLDDVDRDLLDRIGWEPMSLERLAVDSGLPVGELSVRLLDLERCGRIIRRGGAIEQVDRP
jgi:DNA processing protein